MTVDLVPEYWPHVKDMLLKAVDRADGKYDLESIYHKIMAKDMQLWILASDHIHAAGITQVVDFPCKRVCYISFLGGEDLSLWKDTIDIIERVALEWGCDYIEVQGREGWKRALADKDYKQTYIVLRKYLWLTR